MDDTQTLPDVIVAAIARALAAGKPVHPNMVAAYTKQTGLVVKIESPDPNSAPPVNNPRSTQHRRQKTSSLSDAILSGQNPRGFVKLVRSHVTEELLKDGPAFALLSQIALRARWSRERGLNDLGFGECLVGDHAALGMSEKSYRTAKTRLAKWRLAEFRGTAKGTIARLLDDRVFAIEDTRKAAKDGGQSGELFPEEDLQNGASSTPDKGRTGGEQVATKKKGKTEEEGKDIIQAPLARARDRDLLFDALAEATGSNPLEVVGAAARACGVAKAAIQEATLDVTPDEIHRRAANYATHFNASLTPSALARHWAQCATAKGDPRKTRAVTTAEHERGFFSGTEFDQK